MYTPQETQELMAVLETVISTKAQSGKTTVYAEDIVNALCEKGWRKSKAYRVIGQLIMATKHKGVRI